MKKTPNYIKKTLLEAKEELLKNKKLSQTRELYVQKLKEIFKDRVIELKDMVDSKKSLTGTGQSFEELSSNVTANISQPLKNQNELSEKIIFLNNEIVKDHLDVNEIDEANNDLLFHTNEKIIELTDEVNKDQIIELTDEVNNEQSAELENKFDEEALEENSVNLEVSNSELETQDVVDEVISINTNSNEPEEAEKENLEVGEKQSANETNYLPNDKLELLNEKINDLDLNSNELSEKIDELLDQKNLFSEKFNDELDIKLLEALNRTEDNLENKLSNINNVYHEEFGKHEDEVNKNFAHLENQINQLNEQYDNIENNINLISTKIETGIDQSNNTNQNNIIEKFELQFENKINDFKNHNIKIENSLNNINAKITETLEKVSAYRNEAIEKIENIKLTTESQIQKFSETIKNIEPEIVKSIEEKQQNKSESEKLQDKFDQLSKIMDMQNMRMLQIYHSSELQHSHSILQNNMQQQNSTNVSDSKTSDMIKDEMKKELFPKIQDEMDKQFNILRNQLSEYEIKSVLDKIGSTDIGKEFKKPINKFSNLFDAKKYVRNIISKKSRDWMKNNEVSIDEIAKKLLKK